MKIIEKSLGEIRPYKNNPRNNENAVEAVAESIKQCGYIAPIIVDENFIILAGHTRYKALKQLGKKSAEVVVKSGLTEEQKKKYRILDNKTNEFADWDFTKLEEELHGLDFEGFDFDFGELEEIAQEIDGSNMTPVFKTDGVTYENEDEDDPYLPEPYDDKDLQGYTENQENYVIKRRIIITYLPEQEDELAQRLNIQKIDKVVYDIEELF